MSAKAKPVKVVTFHPVSRLFPLLDQGSYEGLREDIAAHGQLVPISTHDGMIVDGRNRYRACLELGIEPRFQEWDGAGSLVEFVLSLNLKRRHLSATQRAVVGYRLLPALEDAAKERQARRSGAAPEILPEQMGDARDQAAAMVGVCGRYVSDVRRIAVEAPELLKTLEVGTLTLQGAKRQLGQSKGGPNATGLHHGGEPMRIASRVIGELSKLKVDDTRVPAVMERVQAYVGNRIREAAARTGKGSAAATMSEEQFPLFAEPGVAVPPMEEKNLSTGVQHGQE